MDLRFEPHNTHLEDPSAFPGLDPHLRQLKRQALVHRSSLLDRMSHLSAGIYSLTGGRQIGKTTLLKQWMLELIESKCRPERILYLAGELIDDHHALVRIVSDALREMPQDGLSYLFVDEITYIHGWDKGVKYLVDAGLLENNLLMLTGSDSVIIKDARTRFPGRRGHETEVDFHLNPLSFYECVRLKTGLSDNDLQALLRDEAEAVSAHIDNLYGELEQYLIHGGFLTAINDMVRHGRISPATLATYSDWIRGDVLKRKKREHYLREIMGAIIRRFGSQVTWNALARDLSIDHPQTVADYLDLLSSMDVVFIQPALREDKLAAAPKKAKKLMFTDPFIFHAVYAWLHTCEDPFETQIRRHLDDSKVVSKLVEACTCTHYKRYYPTYYIKAVGEVDIAYIRENRFWPVEIKWTRQLRPKKFKQINRYSNAMILTRAKRSGKIGEVPSVPLPLKLLQIGFEP